MRKEQLLVNKMIFLNGQFISQDKALVSINDRGFQLGDGIYEVIRCYKGRAFRLDEHIDRLLKSAEAIRLELPYSRDELIEYVKELLVGVSWDYADIYIQATRGSAPRTHEFPAKVSPTVVMYISQSQGVPETTREKGITAIIVPDTRGTLCNIKSVNLLPNVLSRQAAVEAGADEALFEREGIGVVEGAASNIFAVREGVLSTGPLSPYTLPGVTRDCVLQLAKSQGLPTELRFHSRQELLSASEVFITSTSKEVLAITDLAGYRIGNGRPGSITLKLAKDYRALVERECGL
jgi:D-alanine transaminase